MNETIEQPPGAQQLPTNQQPPAGNWLKILGIVVVACVVSTLVALGAVYLYLFPSPFTPVTLNTSEEQVLEQKLERLDSMQRLPTLHKSKRQPEKGTLQPERYSETDANREIILTERELNALLAKNTDLASKLAIDLSQDLASARLRIPLDEDFPILGGKILKAKAGLELAYRDKNPVVALRGISLWGVPIPNAWLGNIKNVDLIKEFGDQDGFWKTFSDGVDEIEVSDGQLRVKLKE